MNVSLDSDFFDASNAPVREKEVDSGAAVGLAAEVDSVVAAGTHQKSAKR